MIITISNAIAENSIIFAVFGVLVTATLSQRRESALFSPIVTAQLKGLAVLFVVLAHIGYFLVDDHRFFVPPLSNYAGVGVDLFLILSGFGLVLSTLKKPVSIKDFYLRRFTKVYLPVVTTVLLLLIVDAVALHRYYPFILNIKNVLGFFPQSDLYQDLNSPLWFITPLLVFYIIFPIIFSRRWPALSALGLGFAVWLFLRFGLGAVAGWIGLGGGVLGLYRLHLLSFPVGMLLGALVQRPPAGMARVGIAFASLMRRWAEVPMIKLVTFVVSALLFLYFLGHSLVGKGWEFESHWSILTALVGISTVVLFPFESRLLSFFGKYSFEIYLLHWPLVYRYDFFYAHLPAGFATILVWVQLLVCAWLYHAFFEKYFFSKLLPSSHSRVVEEKSIQN